MYQTTYSFPQIVNRVTRRIQFSSDRQSINECLGILLRTKPGELLGDPEYGCRLIERVFQFNGVLVAPLIKEDIIDAITKYEPRITVRSEDIQIIQDYRVVHIYIQYEIKDTHEINEYNLEIANQNNPDRI